MPTDEFAKASKMAERFDVAYIYPASFWGMNEASWVKSLLLFFDKVAILLPDYMYGRHHIADPSLAQPLEDCGLLEVLEPKSWIDEEMAKILTETVSGLLVNGVFDDLAKAEYFQELSQSRLGFSVDVELAESLVSKLRDKGLAMPSADGVSVPLHPEVRTTILVLLAQLARKAGSKRNMSVHPTTNDEGAINDLVQTLSRERMPSRSSVIALDLQPVSFDMESIPLEDFIQFRAGHKDSHRAYVRDLRGFMAELAEIDSSDDREALLLQRREELADASDDLQASTRKAFGKNLRSMLLGLVGTSCSFATGDAFGLTLGALGLGLNALDIKNGASSDFSAYSYLFRIERAFGR